MHHWIFSGTDFLIYKDVFQPVWTFEIDLNGTAIGCEEPQRVNGRVQSVFHILDSVFYI